MAKKSKIKTIYSPEYEHIVGKLVEARKDAGLRQNVVADQIGKYQSYLSKIEHGDRRIDILELWELSQIYKKDVNFFLPKGKVEGKKKK